MTLKQMIDTLKLARKLNSRFLQRRQLELLKMAREDLDTYIKFTTWDIEEQDAAAEWAYSTSQEREGWTEEKRERCKSAHEAFHGEDDK